MIYYKNIRNNYCFGEIIMQGKRNFSAKREAIYTLLSSTETHPSAEWIYEQLKPQIPDLSLGTVYRNLAVFKESGLIKSIGIFDGQERFDPNISQHSHFVCTCCFKIIDIPKSKCLFMEQNVCQYVENQCNVRIEDYSITFYGLCEDCSENQAVAVQKDS